MLCLPWLQMCMHAYQATRAKIGAPMHLQSPGFCCLVSLPVQGLSGKLSFSF